MRNLAKDEIEMAARREAMLNEGFRLFAEKGIETVAMQEVAKAGVVGIATLYRYYNTKLALVIDIAVHKWAGFAEFIGLEQERCGVAQMTAAEEFEFYLDLYIILYRNYKDMLRFNQNFNNYVRNEGATEEQLLPYLRAIGVFAGMFHGVYEKGKSDGTIMSTDDTAIMRSLVEQIIVRETEIEIEFKCGVTIRQEYVR